MGRTAIPTSDFVAAADFRLRVGSEKIGHPADDVRVRPEVERFETVFGLPEETRDDPVVDHPVRHQDADTGRRFPAAVGEASGKLNNVG